MARLIGPISAVLLALTSGLASALADPVQVKLGDRRLNANLEIPEGRNLGDLGIAIVLHDALGFHGEPTIAALQKNLKVRGIATLAVTLSLGVDDRKGPRACDQPHAYTEADAAAELERWLDWVAHNGVRAVDYIGFSRGGAQLVDFLQKQKGGRRVVLLAPALPAGPEIAGAYRKAFNQELAIALEAARAKPAETRRVDYLSCRQAMVKGSTFLEAYREVPANSLSNIVQQTLVVLAGNDEVVPDLEARLPPKIRYVVIEGSDHFFRDLNAEDAADVVAEFLRE
jgi:pimeloyl-ACP methyl ester carboxylesterase